MRRTAAVALFGALVLALAPTARAAPTDAQKCEADVESAAGKFFDCRLKAESSSTKTGDTAKLAAAQTQCATKLAAAFAKAASKYGGSCPAAANGSAVESYVTQCSKDAAAAAGGASLPDYQAELAACEVAPHARVFKTGQTTCWNTAGNPIACTGTGQDGEFQRGLAVSHTDNGDGTITDDNTGLMWEKLSDDSSIHDDGPPYYTWEEAFSVKIAALNAGGGFAGYSDWRVPNASEAQSIRWYGDSRESRAWPAFNNGCVPGCTVLTCSCPGGGWTSTSNLLNIGLEPADEAWFVADHGLVRSFLKTWTASVRAVRGGP